MNNPLASTIISESRTLWIGDVESWMDESYIASLFGSTGSVVSVKVIRDKNTGMPAGYGFVEFNSHEIASQVLGCYNGAPIPNTNKNFRLNWGIFGGGTKTSTLTNVAPVQKVVQTATPDYSIYVGDIDAQVNDMILLEFFQKRYKSVVSAKVIVDPITKYSKGYGFVKFSNFEESQRAISEMQGSLLRGRHIKTSQSFWKSANQDSNYLSSFTMGMTSGVVSPQMQTAVSTGYPTNQAASNSMPNYYMNYYNPLMGATTPTNSLSYYEAMLPYLQSYQNNPNSVGMGGNMDSMMNYAGNSYLNNNMTAGMDYYQPAQQQYLGNAGAMSNNQYIPAQATQVSSGLTPTNNQNSGYPIGNYQTNYPQNTAITQNFAIQNKNINAQNPAAGMGQNVLKNVNNYQQQQTTYHNYNTSANQIIQQDLLNNAQISTNYGTPINYDASNKNIDVGGVSALPVANYFAAASNLNDSTYDTNRINLSSSNISTRNGEKNLKEPVESLMSIISNDNKILELNEKNNNFEKDLEFLESHYDYINTTTTLDLQIQLMI